MKTEVMYFPRELVERGLKLGPSAWTLLSVVLGQTYVKCQVSAEISVQEFADQTTLTEKQIQKALDKLYGPDIPVRIYAGANAGTFRFSFEDDVRERYHPRYRPAREALTESGVDPESITAIVNCHMHSDHAGGNHEFPGVTIYVSRSNWTTRARPTSPTRSTRATSRARRSR